MIQLGQRLCFPEEPRADLVVGIEIDPEAHPTVERLVVSDEQHSLARGCHHGLEPIPVAEGGVGALVVVERRRGSHPATRRRRITAAASRDSPGVVQPARGDRNAPGCTNGDPVGE